METCSESPAMPADALQEFAANLKTWRKRKRISQQDLADRVGISRQSMNRHESAKVMPTEENLQKYAEALEIPIDYLRYGRLKEGLGFRVYTEITWK